MIFNKTKYVKAIDAHDNIIYYGPYENRPQQWIYYLGKDVKLENEYKNKEEHLSFLLSKERDKNKELKRQINYKDNSLHEKNLKLDAMHYVWCNGGCDSGVHRWFKEELTEEIVKEAESNTARLRTWFRNYKHKNNNS